MKYRFDTLGLKFSFVESKDAHDPSIMPPIDVIQKANELGRWIPHAWSCIHGHFDILEQFLATGEEVCIVCEDDILLRRDFAYELPVIKANFDRQILDILLLGYLTETDEPARVVHNKPLKSPAFSYHAYDSEWGLWGTQMYMIRRSYAQMLVKQFGPNTDYKINALLNSEIEFWIADCIITKMGNRAFISPQMAVEEGTAGIPHQQPTHTNSYQLNYDPNIHF
jgi:hypothetical protein